MKYLWIKLFIALASIALLSGIILPWIISTIILPLWMIIISISFLGIIWVFIIEKFFKRHCK